VILTLAPFLQTAAGAHPPTGSSVATFAEPVWGTTSSKQATCSKYETYILSVFMRSGREPKLISAAAFPIIVFIFPASPSYDRQHRQR
jgi:hypothetical protein